MRKVLCNNIMSNGMDCRHIGDVWSANTTAIDP